ncbi:hypothetical protein HPB47_026758 [Ixodes persulcatus]|uniref:Uncharacterized protein n=1 Tax=Ixodes persulcatus TaxID=34615 RepID=A0AC60PY80_IXOPE|nr:hypothetical protein HPB47_026758 [Ixodes persulcatus]
MLRHCLGIEGQRVFDNLPSSRVVAVPSPATTSAAATSGLLTTNVYQDAVNALSAHFKRRVSKYWQPPRYARICNRHFRGHKKSDDINDANYVPSIFPKMSDTHGFTKKQLARYKSSQELCKRKMMLLGQLPDVVANGAEDDSKPAVKFETSSVGVGCSLKLDGQSGNANLLVFSCFSDGRNVATQACVPGRRKFADRGTQAGMGTLPPSNPCLDPRDGGAR